MKCKERDIQEKRYKINTNCKYKTEMKHSLDLGFIQRDVGFRKLDQQGRGKDDREF